MTKREEFDGYIRRFYGLAETTELDAGHRGAAFERAIYDIRSLARYLRRERYSPYLLREFVERHWNYAISSPSNSDEFVVAAKVMEEINNQPEPLRSQWLAALTKTRTLPLEALRCISAALEGRR